MHERRKAFPKPGTAYLPPKQKDIRFLLLSIALGLVFCAIFAFALFFLNKQGRLTFNKSNMHNSVNAIS